MINRKKRLFVFISIAIALLLAGILFYFFVNKNNPSQSDENTSSDDQVETNTNTVDNNPTTSPVAITGEEGNTNTEPNIDTKTDSRVRAKQIARIFVERFASYSSQNDNFHIETTLPMVTDNMSDWVEKQKVEQENNYSGVTTNVIVTSVSEINEDDSATVQVNTQQIINKSDSSQEKKQKSGRVELIWENEDWKVDGFFWD